MKPCTSPTIVEFVRMSGRRFWSRCRLCVLAVLLTGAAGASAQTLTDYDDNDNGLIDIRTLAQLNAMRWDLNGDGQVAAGDTTNYSAAFPNPAAGMGCPSGCTGYELKNDLDFDTDDDGSTWTDVGGTPTSDSGDAYHNGGNGWQPIGDGASAPFNATFNGNGKIIWNLFISRGGNNRALFAVTATSSTNRIMAVGLANARVESTGENVGTLVGSNKMQVSASWSSGSVRGSNAVGGLVGLNHGPSATVHGAVVASYSIAAVECTSSNSSHVAGGLVGFQNSNATITSSYATGKVTGTCGRKRGIVAMDTAANVASTYWDIGLSGIAVDSSAAGEGKTTTALQTPTAYGTGTTTLYSTWDDVDVDGNGGMDDAWNFGTSLQHPVLKFAGFDTAIQFSAAQPPTFSTTTVAAMTFRTGVAVSAFQIPVALRGAGGAALTYTATGLPPGLSFDADGSGACGAARTICGTPTFAATYTIVVRVENSYGIGTSLSFAVTVNGIVIDADPTTSSIDAGPLVLNEDTAHIAHSKDYTVKLSTAPTGPVTVTIASGDPGAVTVEGTGELTFGTSTWNTAQTVALTAAQDADGADESVTITHTAIGGDYTSASASLTATVDDNTLVSVVVDADPSTSEMVDAGPLILDEATARSKNYAVRLGVVPTGPVTVTVTRDNAVVTVDTDSGRSGNQTTLSFTALNWNTWQTVTAKTSVDADAVDEVSNVVHTASGVTEYVGVSTSLRVGVQDAQQTGTDYDSDLDGLIEIDSLAQLNAMRWDLDGDGVVAAGSDTTNYSAAFSSPAAGMGCPDGGDSDSTPDACTGYELANDLDFDTDGDGSTWAAGTPPVGDSGDAYHDSGSGWLPIGTSGTPFNTTFDGNGRVVWNLFVNRSTDFIGLFGYLGTAARITSVGLANALVRGSANNTGMGALAGHNSGRIAASWSSGSVAGWNSPGGLVGQNRTTTGVVVASYSTVAVHCHGIYVSGGLVGFQDVNARIESSYATGAATGTCGRKRGIVAKDTAVNVASTYWDIGLSGISADSSAAGEGKSTTALQMPTAYGTTTLYSTWDDVDVDGDGVAGVALDADDDVWNFGSSSQHPVLKVANFDTALQFNSQGTDQSPTFGASTVTAKTYRNGQTIVAFQIPVASNGNGALVYTAAGLPDGLSFDADGAGACGAARTVCGTPTTDGSSTTTITVVDGDDNTHATDRDTLTFAVTVVTPSATISATSPATLTESNLDDATLTVALTGTTFASGVAVSSFTLTTDVPGLTIGSVATTSSGATSTTLTLDYAGTNFDSARTLTVTVASAAHALVGDLTTGAVTVSPTRGVTLSTSTLRVPENTNEEYTVKLDSQPAGGDVTITISSVGSGLTASPTSLTFTNTDWSTAQTVTVNAPDDGNADDESVTLTHTPSGMGTDYASGVAAKDLIARSTDDDRPGLQVSPPSLTVNEGGTGTYAVRLNTDPGGNVTVTVGGTTAEVTVDTAATTGTQTTLTFSSADWSTAQTVTVSAAEDDDATNEMPTLAHTASGAADYMSLDVRDRPSVAVTVSDNDTPALVVDTNPTTSTIVDGGTLAVTESDTAQYTVRLATEPTDAVTVTATSGDAAVEVDAGGSPLTLKLTFSTSTWSMVQTVTARGAEDDDGGNESVDITHAATGGDYGVAGVAATLTVEVTDNDPRELTLASTSTLAGLDENTNTTYTVALRTEPTGPVEVSITNSDASAATVDADGGRPGLQDTLTFTTSTWSTAQPVTVSALEDNNGRNETITLMHDPSGADYGLVVNAPLTFTLADNDPKGVTLSTSTLSVPENGHADYTVKLDTEPVGGNVTITISGGAGSGLSANPTLLTFTNADWSTAQAVRVSAADDNNSANESVVLTHTPSGADYTSGVGVEDLTATAADDDRPGLQVDPRNLAMEEGDTKTYTVRLNTDPGGNVTVTVSGTTAEVTVDTAATSSIQTTLTFSSTDWSTVQTVTVKAEEDDDASDETATLAHAASGASDYASLNVADRPSVTVTVDDDDTPALVVDTDPTTLTVTEGGPLAVTENDTAQYTVRLATEPIADVTVTATSGDLAVTLDADSSPLTLALTFSASTWDTAQTVTASGAEDDDGDDESATITHLAAGGDYDDVSASLVAAVSDNDSLGLALGATSSLAGLDENSSATYTVALTTAPTGPVTVAVSSSDASAATVDVDGAVGLQTMLTFLTNTWNMAQAVTVATPDDYDGEDETITLTHDPSGADYRSAPNAMLEFTLDDDDTRGVTLSASTLLVQENGSANYTVKLDTQPVGGRVTVAISGAADGIAASPASLTFTAADWSTARTVRVNAAADGNSVNESATLAHTVSGADYGTNGVTAGSVVVNASDTSRPGLRVVPSMLTVNEGGAGTYAVRLNTNPGGNVTVTVGGTTAEVTVDTAATSSIQTTLTFSSTNWSAAQSVTVSAAVDDDATNEMLTLTHAATGTVAYASLAADARPGVLVTVDDNDEPALVIDADPTTSTVVESGPLTLNEQLGHSDKEKPYTVRLATEPAATVTVTVGSGDRAVTVDSGGTPYTKMLTFGTLTWSTAQTVTATAVDDVDASDERVTIAHSASGGDYRGVSANLVATTVDDDAPGLLLVTTALVTSGVPEGGTATYTVRLATEPSGTVTVTATATGDAEVDMDGGQAGRQSTLRFDATNWNVAREATVRGLADADGADGTATLRHTASGAGYGSAPALETTFAVHDDDPLAVLVGSTALDVNEGSTVDYTVVLATRPVGGTVMVSASSSAVAVATVTPATLRFGAGDWDVPKTFRVQGVADVDDADGSATVTHTVSGADYGTGPVVASSVTVLVRDAQAAGVRIDPPTLALGEGGRGVYRVRLNTDPGGAVTVTATSGSAELAVDGDATPQERTLTFTGQNWDREQAVTVTVGSDGGVDDETLTVTHAVTGYVGVSSAPALAVHVEDDDAPGLAFAPADGLLLKEGDPSSATGMYRVWLTFAPSGPVTVAVSSDDVGVAVDADSGTPGDQVSLTFGVLNWSTAQTVTVRAAWDGDAATETAMLLHRASGGGYDGATGSYAVRVSDADAAPAPTRVSASSAGATSLAVRWTPSAGAEGHLVQWRRSGEAWSAARQLELPGGAGSARIDGLSAGVEYEVRVLGLNRGDPGDPSSEARATPRPARVNRAPVPSAALEDIRLLLGETRTVDLAGAFQDPDGDALSYEALSLDETVVDASVSGAELRLRTVGTGQATVYVWAVDPGGLQASQTLLATVSAEQPMLSATVASSAPEGGEARLTVELSVPRQTATRFLWSTVPDEDASTADADTTDLAVSSGESTIPAGATRVEIAIGIAEDAEIEPAREWFEVSLSVPDGCCAVSDVRARVAVLEGVCDRTPAVRDALRGEDACSAPTPASLAAVQTLSVSGAGSLRVGDFGGLPGLRTLNLSGNGLAALPAGLFMGLGSLRELDLSGNALPALPAEAFAALSDLRTLLLEDNAMDVLPAGLFAGLGRLREASLLGNPGAPFALVVELARTDADPWAAGPAMVEARLASAAPFALRAVLSAEPAQTDSDAPLPSVVEVAAGESSGTPFRVIASTLRLRHRAGHPAERPLRRGGCAAPVLPRFYGRTGTGADAVRDPLTTLPTPTLDVLAGGDGLRLPVASLVVAGDVDLRWLASSSDESVADGAHPRWHAGGGAGAGRRGHGGDHAGGDGRRRPRHDGALLGAGGVPLADTPGQRLAWHHGNAGAGLGPQGAGDRWRVRSVDPIDGPCLGRAGLYGRSFCAGTNFGTGKCFKNTTGLLGCQVRSAAKAGDGSALGSLR